jgi:hypothetical protein
MEKEKSWTFVSNATELDALIPVEMAEKLARKDKVKAEARERVVANKQAKDKYKKQLKADPLAKDADRIIVLTGSHLPVEDPAKNPVDLFRSICLKKYGVTMDNEEIVEAWRTEKGDLAAKFKVLTLGSVHNRLVYRFGAWNPNPELEVRAVPPPTAGGDPWLRNVLAKMKNGGVIAQWAHNVRVGFTYRMENERWTLVSDATELDALIPVAMAEELDKEDKEKAEERERMVMKKLAKKMMKEDTNGLQPGMNSLVLMGGAGQGEEGGGGQEVGHEVGEEGGVK